MQCDKCKRFYFNNKCNCKPHMVYEIEDETEEDAIEVYANFPDEAAEKYAEDMEIEDIINNSVDLMIINEKGSRVAYRVSAEPSVNYHATQIDLPSEG